VYFELANTSSQGGCARKQAGSQHRGASHRLSMTLDPGILNTRNQQEPLALSISENQTPNPCTFSTSFTTGR